jgi:hypothetical protein
MLLLGNVTETAAVVNCFGLAPFSLPAAADGFGVALPTQQKGELHLKIKTEISTI